VARLMNRRALRSASTSRTCWDVNALMCSGRPARPSKWHTPGQGAGGEVFSQLQPRRRPADHPGAGDELFDFPADIGRDYEHALAAAHACGYRTVSVFHGRERREVPLG